MKRYRYYPYKNKLPKEILQIILLYSCFSKVKTNQKTTKMHAGLEPSVSDRKNKSKWSKSQNDMLYVVSCQSLVVTGSRERKQKGPGPVEISSDRHQISQQRSLTPSKALNNINLNEQKTQPITSLLFFFFFFSPEQLDFICKTKEEQPKTNQKKNNKHNYFPKMHFAKLQDSPMFRQQVQFCAPFFLFF